MTNFLEDSGDPESLITKFRDEASQAHHRLIWIAKELNWATDGKLLTAVRHAEEMDRVLRKRLEAAKKPTEPDPWLVETATRLRSYLDFLEPLYIKKQAPTFREFETLYSLAYELLVAEKQD